MIGTQTRCPASDVRVVRGIPACRGLGAGDLRGRFGVSVTRNRSGWVAAAALAVALSGCSSLGIDNDQPLFRKQFDFTGKAGGYSFSDTQQVRQAQPITANDLIAANGSCSPPPAAPVAPAATPNPAVAPVVAPDTPSLLGEGVALGMSECEVVWRAGAPNNVELGKNPNGERTAVLTFDSGPRPGIYRFERGRLMEMDSVAPPPAPPQVAKKKPVKPKKPPNNNAA
jgi:hypothetical protein